MCVCVRAGRGLLPLGPLAPLPLVADGNMYIYTVYRVDHYCNVLIIL